MITKAFIYIDCKIFLEDSDVLPYLRTTAPKDHSSHPCLFNSTGFLSNIYPPFKLGGNLFHMLVDIHSWMSVLCGLPLVSALSFFLFLLPIPKTLLLPKLLT